jgi:uncharacterized protein (DUF305 family)
MTKSTSILSLAAAAILSASPVALGQDAHVSSYNLPAICTSDATPSAHPAPHTMNESPDEAHQDLAKGMDQMNSAMAQGMSAADIDVAFVCSMIPHHQGAIDMARAELAHGDDPWVKEMAQKVIDAQEAEIAEMRAWLNAQPR